MRRLTSSRLSSTAMRMMPDAVTASVCRSSTASLQQPNEALGIAGFAQSTYTCVLHTCALRCRHM